MRFYASKCHDRLNGMDFRLEDDTEYLMLNPKYPVTLSRPVRYMLDSGAFQDVRAESRLTYQGALDRQMGFERRVGQRADRIVSYDRLVDEQKTPAGGQFKARVDEDTGAEYVEDTIKAAEFLASRRESLEGRTLVLSCQGTTVGQYLGCVSSVMDVAEPGDTIGIGGFCIMSRRKEYQEQYRDIMGAAVPAIAGGGGSEASTCSAWGWYPGLHGRTRYAGGTGSWRATTRRPTRSMRPWGGSSTPPTVAWPRYGARKTSTRGTTRARARG